MGTAFAYLKDRGLAEDVAQESFVVAWRQLRSLRDPSLFLAWFRRIVISQCHRVLRKKSVDPLHVGPDDPEGVEKIVAQKEQARAIREALEHLPRASRVAVVLFYFSGRSHAAIARFLGVPRSTVVKRLYSARQKLKSALASFIEGSRPSRHRAFAAMVRAGIYNDYVGLYRFEERPELTVRVKRSGSRLISFSAGQQNSAIPGTRISELRAREFDGRARFVRNKSGRVTHFIYYEFGQRMGTARKIE